MSIAYLVNLLFEALFWILFVFVFLTWIPTIKWEKQPFKIIKLISDTIFAPFRMLIPPIGGLDLTPIFALLFIQFAGAIIVRALVSLNL